MPHALLSTAPPTIDESRAHCRAIALGHYENFPVASVLLPRAVREDIYPIYAFARTADDLADEHGDREGLLAWREHLHAAARGEADHPVFVALAEVMSRRDLPVEPFDDLLSAFLQDLDTTRYPSMDNLLDYCRRSANPVGRLILHLHDVRDARCLAWSDAICTALQLTNFWQDVRLDRDKERIYIPGDAMTRHGVSEDQIHAGRFDGRFAALMADLVADTRDRFSAGLPLLTHIRGRLHWELKFTVLGGLAILDKIERLGYDTLSTRPVLTRFDWLRVAAGAIGNVTVTR